MNGFLVVKYRLGGVLRKASSPVYIRWGINEWKRPPSSQEPADSLWYYDYVETPMHREIDGLFTIAISVTTRMDQVDFLFVQWSQGLRDLDDDDGRRWVWTNPAQYYKARDLYNDLLGQAQDQGVSVANFTSILEDAEASAEAGEYSYARSLLNHWTEILGRRVMEVLISQDWQRVEVAKQRGVDTSRIETYLKAAESRLKFGPWNYAEGYVEKVGELHQIEAGQLFLAPFLLITALLVRRRFGSS